MTYIRSDRTLPRAQSPNKIILLFVMRLSVVMNTHLFPLSTHTTAEERLYRARQ